MEVVKNLVGQDGVIEEVVKKSLVLSWLSLIEFMCNCSCTDRTTPTWFQ